MSDIQKATELSQKYQKELTTEEVIKRVYKLEEELNYTSAIDAMNYLKKEGWLENYKDELCWFLAWKKELVESDLWKLLMD